MIHHSRIIACLFIPGATLAGEDAKTFSQTQTLNPKFAEVAKVASPVGINWRSTIKVPSPPASASEIHILAKLQQERSTERQTRIEQQDLADFRIFEKTADEKPATKKLCELVQFEMVLCALILKEEFDRVRPSFLDPAIVPTVAVPACASYPSEHAMGSHLNAFLLAALNPPKKSEYEAIAADISVNREYAGIQYRSDTFVGKLVARRMARELSKNPIFQAHFFAAAEEWGSKTEAIQRLQRFAAEGFIQTKLD